jgi:membrane-associated phospholipid phosphatase
MFKIQQIQKLVILVASLSIFFASCTGPEQPLSPATSQYSHEAISKWNEKFLEVERYAAGFRPGPAPRALGYMGLAAYEACITGMEGYKSIAPNYSGLVIPPTETGVIYHWPTVVNGVYSYMMPEFFAASSPQQLFDMALLTKELDNKYKVELDIAVFERSKAYGEKVGKAVFEYAATDKLGHEYYKDPAQNYNWKDAFKKDGDFVPANPNGKAMFANWGNVRTFAVKESEKICRPPIPYSASKSSKYYAQGLEVYSMNTPSIGYVDQWIAEFWSDDLLNVTFSPPPRWIAIGDQVLAAQNSTLETAIFMNVKMGIALNDAGVACWKSKFYYNVERPNTYIVKNIDPNWKTNLNNPITGEKGITPAFPAYPSGHATFGAAGAEVLSSMFGYNYAMTDNCHKNRVDFLGAPRSFASFYQMADENGWSRVPLGVHWRMDAEEGVRFGYEIGRKVNNMPWK